MPIVSRASNSVESVSVQRRRDDGRVAEEPERAEEARALAPVRRLPRLGEIRLEELHVAVPRGHVEDLGREERVHRLPVLEPRLRERARLGDERRLVALVRDERDERRAQELRVLVLARLAGFQPSAFARAPKTSLTKRR